MAGAGVDEGMSPVGMAPVGTAPLGTVPAGVVSAAPAVGNDWNGWVWSDAKFNGGMVSVAALDTSSCSDISATSARLIVSPFSPDCGGTAFTPSNEMPARLLSVSFCPLLSDMYVVSSFTLLTVHTMQHDTQTSAQTNTLNKLPRQPPRRQAQPIPPFNGRSCHGRSWPSHSSIM